MSGRQFDEIANGRLLAGVDRVAAESPVSARTAAGLLALLSVAATTLYRVVHNAPGTLPGGVTDLAAVGLPVAVVGPAFGALLLATAADRPVERVGLAFAGSFGLVALASPAAWLPAAVGMVGGVTLVAWSEVRELGRSASRTEIRRTGVVAVLAGSVVVSLAATGGIAAGTFRPLGTVLALVGVGATPLFVGSDRPSLIVGALAAVLTFAVATSVPYVAGAVLLIGGGVVGAPIGLVVLAAGGGVAGLTRAFRTRDTDAVLAVGTLLATGVPGTLLRALGVVVAVALLVGSDVETTGGERR
ncbi:hypothetical protein SAMN04487949_3367 [Halogranum gelatinilyticum]|uniref:DUF8068 domain-containing protein n=1 Tax=Halogranum gelatinilyticum TaxID=660521 RepID=A0A1G9YNA6_9EURY|nr:hypothetical protein [Halogranum gelatinilyticum]SDN10031.1 hypothetical protein SAMN04487949_3367 [Halogranum gelatinilyticum]